LAPALSASITLVFSASVVTMMIGTIRPAARMAFRASIPSMLGMFQSRSTMS